MIKQLKVIINKKVHEADKEYRNLLDEINNGSLSAAHDAMINVGWRSALNWMLIQLDKDMNPKIYHISWRPKNFVSEFGGEWKGGGYAFGISKFHAIAEFIESYMEHIDDIDDYEFQAKLHKGDR